MYKGMPDEVHLSDVATVLEELAYPISDAEAAAALADVTVLYADGEEPLSALVERTTSERFDSAAELETDLRESAPVEAIGEPGQSEGDA